MVEGDAEGAGRAGGRLCYTSQTLGEFWNASTRPFGKNSFGLTVPKPTASRA